MKNESIAENLKSSRKQNHLTVQEVAQKLKEHNNPVAVKTIYGWESGHSQPDADTLLFLCELYNIDNVLETFGYMTKTQPEPLALTEDERLLVLSYRKHPSMHEAIRRLLKMGDR